MSNECQIVSQGDELMCPICGLRWDAREDRPDCPTRVRKDRIESINRRLQQIVNTGRISGREGPEYDALRRELAELNNGK